MKADALQFSGKRAENGVPLADPCLTVVVDGDLDRSATNDRCIDLDGLRQKSPAQANDGGSSQENIETDFPAGVFQPCTLSTARISICFKSRRTASEDTAIDTHNTEIP